MKNIRIDFYVRKANHQQKYAHFLKAGMERHGYTNIHILPDYNAHNRPDLAVFWAHKRSNIIQTQKKHGLNYLVMERAYIGDRFNWMSLGYNGLNGRADFCNRDKTDLKRWDRYFDSYLKPWKSGGEYALVAGQVSSDASVSDININNWYAKVIKRLNEKGIPVVFRPHPLNKSPFKMQDLKYKLDTNEHLETTLTNAKFLVSYNSNSGVIGVLNGVPTITYDIGSMVYNVTTHDVDEELITPDRKDWQSKISYCQWLPEELASGKAWEHLKVKYEK